MGQPFFLVQLSDPHIGADWTDADPVARLAAAIESARALCPRPDAVLVTGDLTDHASDAEYEQVLELLAPLGDPLYVLPGNHDDRDQMRRSFPSHTYLGTDGFIQYSVKIGALRLIALDTVVHGKPEGRLCAERLAWLAETLERHRDEPVIVALHHPPFETLIGLMDKIGLVEGGEDALDVFHEHLRVEVRLAVGGVGGTVQPLAVAGVGHRRLDDEGVGLGQGGERDEDRRGTHPPAHGRDGRLPLRHGTSPSTSQRVVRRPLR